MKHQENYTLKLNYCSCVNHSCNCVVFSGLVNNSAVTCDPFYSGNQNKPFRLHPQTMFDKFDIPGFVIDESVTDMRKG